MISCRTMENKIKNKKYWKKVRVQDSMGKTILFLGHPTLKPLGSFSDVIAYISSSKSTRKVNLQHIFNKKSPWTHMESDFDALSVAGKLLKYVVHLSINN
jgi:hypothetical protein